MKDYQYKYINQEIKDEIDELLSGVHGKALKAWSMECGNAAIEGCKDALLKASVLAIGGVAAAYKVVKKIRKVFNKRVAKRINRLSK